MKKFYVIDKINDGVPVIKQVEGYILTISDIRFGIVKEGCSWYATVLELGLCACMSMRTKQSCIDKINEIMPTIKKVLSTENYWYDRCKVAIKKAKEMEDNE